jgi:type II secretory pathway component PulL
MSPGATAVDRGGCVEAYAHVLALTAPPPPEAFKTAAARYTRATAMALSGAATRSEETVFALAVLKGARRFVVWSRRHAFVMWRVAVQSEASGKN